MSRSFIRSSRRTWGCGSTGAISLRSRHGRALPHKEWWGDFLRKPAGVGFWHETYFARGGFEAIYDGLDGPFGFTKFAQEVPAEGAMFSARRRLRLPE